MPEVLDIEFHPKFAPLFEPKRNKVYYGGRGGLKSWAVARALLLRGAKEKLFILCTRELQGSIQDSVHRLLSNQINELKLESFYDIQKNRITGLNGTEFVFEGLKNNVTKIKSFEGADICWCEEAEAISEHSWEVLLPTIRKPGSEVWITFNPSDELDPTYQMWIVNPPKDTVVVKTSWRDAEEMGWFPEELRQQMLDCKEKNYKKYLHIWEGEPNADYEDSIIQPEWVLASIDAHLKIRNWEPQGLKVLGFDPADEGTDQKAYAERHGTVVTEVFSWDKGDLLDATRLLMKRVFEERINHVVYDNVGLGAAVKAYFKSYLEGSDIVAEGFGGSESVRDKEDVYEDDRKNKDVFRNLRAQYWWYLRDRFEKTYRVIEYGELIDPEELISISSKCTHLKELRSELCRVQRKRSRTHNLVQVESKEDMKKDGRSSPNLADALVMAFANSYHKKRRKNMQPRINIA